VDRSHGSSEGKNVSQYTYTLKIVISSSSSECFKLSNAEMVSKSPSCYCMLLMWPSGLKFLRPLFHIYIRIITTATGRQSTCIYITIIIIIIRVPKYYLYFGIHPCDSVRKVRKNYLLPDFVYVSSGSAVIKLLQNIKKSIVFLFLLRI
jgi:hypothetical protein